MEIIKFLKEQHQFTHGFANLVAHKANEANSGSAENQDDLITKLPYDTIKRYAQSSLYRGIGSRLVSEVGIEEVRKFTTAKQRIFVFGSETKVGAW